MGWQKFFLSLGIRAIVICPALVSFLGVLPQPLQAHPELQVSLKFPPTEPRPDVPARTPGGGTRRGPSCTQQGKIPLTVLMPTSNVGTTVAANPTLFWYVPQTTAKAADFVIFDDKDNQVYQVTLALPGTPGIANYSLPANVSLEAGKTYKWQFALVCQPRDPSGDQLVEVVEGLIKRTELSPKLKAQLVQAPPLEQAKLYAQAGIWQETLTILAQLRSSRPTEWEELLKSVGLDAIAQAPFAEYRAAEK